VRAELIRGAGTQWRERAVRTFVEMIDEERAAASAELMSTSVTATRTPQGTWRSLAARPESPASTN